MLKALEAIPVELKPSALAVESAEIWDTYKDGELSGHYVVLRRGRHAIQFVVEGHVFEESDELERLLAN